VASGAERTLSGFKAGTDFVALMARLEAAPFQIKIQRIILANSSAANFLWVERTHI
jgi:hypothetical protein